MRWMRVVTVVGVLALALVGCSGDDGEGTTTTAGDIVTTLPSAGVTSGGVSTGGGTAATGTGGSAATTSTTSAPIGPPEYEIAKRNEAEAGATVVVLLDPNSYTSLSDLDLQGVIRDVYERFPPVLTVHVVDEAEAVDLVLLERALTDDELTVLDAHYLARLEDGIRIVYVGPFDEFPIAILGS
ncbi:MAG: hypothetical protein OEM97_11635 [Acidimicrobiia bacterium]|nr:hypothetical protein [Acidimicrobiia bacterium]